MTDLLFITEKTMVYLQQEIMVFRVPRVIILHLLTATIIFFPFYFKEIGKIINESSPDVVVTSGYYWGNEKKSNAVKLNIPHNISTDDNSFYRLLADRVYPSGLVFFLFSSVALLKKLSWMSLYISMKTWIISCAQEVILNTYRLMIVLDICTGKEVKLIANSQTKL